MGFCFTGEGLVSSRLTYSSSWAGKRGQAYNLNIADSVTAPLGGRYNSTGNPKCYVRQKSNRVAHQLRRQGWKDFRIWQHSLKKSPNACLTRIRRALAS